MSDRRQRWPFVLLAVTAASVAVFLPALFGHPRLNESFWIDWVWLDQFARELSHGSLYPRWLPLSHNGLGSPVFYYYPPLAFYFGSLFVLAGLSIYAAIVATFVAASMLSGVGAYLWLKGQSRSPVTGAIVSVIAPYHAFDFYFRGALAEAIAIAAIPFVMLGLRMIGEKRSSGIPLTAVAYGALIGSHLPLALLASVFLIGPYAAWRGYRAPRELLAVAAGLAIGLALACIYLVPALGLEQYRDAAVLWRNRTFQPSNWTFWNAEFLTGVYLVVLGIACALAIPAVALIVRTRSRWAGYALVCILLGIGLVPFLWSAPALRSVQFPFRIMPLAEFGLATAFARIAWTRRKLAEALAPLLIATAFVSVARTPPDPVTIAELSALHPDVPENLPPGERPYSWPSIWALDVAKAHRRAQYARGVTTEPLFYFPAWRVRCGDVPVATFPAPDTQLLSYRGKACARSPAVTSAEKIGAAMSLIGFLALIVVIGLGRRKRD
ncbi:MAG TPA: 6-pyruvoyl-tetrahydropterin synthase-related protein [Sphingomicrobium sp.]|nr:6-pyruvoyl-tetrahydropterin synthase-related protein [Sphingomicrobium sp.]